MKIGKDINVARSYAKKQGYDCFITKCKRGNYHVKGCYEFKGNTPSNLVEIVRYVANKDILSDTKGGKSKTTNKKRKSAKPRVKRGTTKSDTK